jgi:hypothetical protein
VDANLETLANFAEILGAIVVVGGVAFAVIQIRQFRRQRLEIASIELVRSFQSPEFTRAHTFLLTLPNGVSAEELRQRSGDAEAFAMVVSTTFESIGVMVYRRILPIDIVDELMGGTIVSFWGKLDKWIETLREEQGRDDTHEWFQWLAAQLARRSPHGVSQPAYVEHLHWKA